MVLEHPYLLLLSPLALLPLLRLFRGGAGGPAVALPPGVRAVGTSWRVQLLWLAPALSLLIAGLSLLAAAGPCGGTDVRPNRRHARDIFLVIDTSESMRAVDFQREGISVSRMEGARGLASQFLLQREADRVGIVAFGARAVTQCPLTFDRRIAVRLLAYVEPEMLGKRTALGDAVALGVARLTEGGALVLLTDGENTAGLTTPEEAAAAAVARGVRVYAIGLGSAGPAPVPVRLPSGRVRIADKDYRLDEAALRALADASGGRFFRAQDGETLADVFAEIDRLETSPKAAPRMLPAHRLAGAFAAAGTATMLLLMLVSTVALPTAPLLR
jgi:Ca-activated chloride channel family protein